MLIIHKESSLLVRAYLHKQILCIHKLFIRIFAPAKTLSILQSIGENNVATKASKS